MIEPRQKLLVELITKSLVSFPKIKSEQRWNLKNKLDTVFQGFAYDETLHDYMNTRPFLESIYAGLGIPASLLNTHNSPALPGVEDAPPRSGEPDGA